MEAISTIDGRAVAMGVPNIDTDQIIPARFLKYKVADGYQNFLFHDLRFDENGEPRAEFVLNRHPNATIVLAGDNFGCGSSREGAVQALQHHGIRAVIAESFGQIFENNCLKNGLLPVRLPTETMAGLLARYGHGVAPMSIDLPTRRIRDYEGNTYGFELDDFWHTLLMQGMDTLDLTLSRMDEVLSFEKQRAVAEPWILPPRGNRQEEQGR